MQICSYCFSKNLETDMNCCHCKAPLNIERPILRDTIEIEQIDIFYADYFELKNLNAIELLHLLRYARMERRKYYTQDIEFLEQSNEYKTLSKQQKLIENLLFDIYGRIPKLLTPSDLGRYKNLQKRTITYFNSITEKVLTSTPKR